jgi:RNA polymerase sigma-70 factor (ECF subfamily)
MHAAGILVLTLTAGEIAAVTRFDNSVLPFFGLPRTRPV